MLGSESHRITDLGVVITSYSIHYTKLYELITLTAGITNTGTLTAGAGGVTAAATADFSGGTLDINGAAWAQTAGNLVLGTLSNPAGSTITFSGAAIQGFTTNAQALDNVTVNMGAAATTLTVTGAINQSANTVITSYSIHYTKLYEYNSCACIRCTGAR